MCKNETVTDDFMLLGFNIEPKLKTPLFFLFLVIYVIILTGNIMIVALVSMSHHLNLPMYVFLKHLALADILFTTNIIPNMLSIIWSEGGIMSLAGCCTQLYFHSLAGFAQSLILMVMSLDRYLAISHPLHYTLIMNQKLCFHLIFWSWGFGFAIIPSEMILLSQLKFCGSNIIDHFFCDIVPIFELSSSDTSIVKWEDFVLSILVIFIPFVFVIVSYFCIFMTIIKIKTADGRQKAFSTCSSHLLTVCMYYGSLIIIYMVPVGGNTSLDNKFTSLLYTVLTPLINPIIYSLRSQEIRRYIKKLICRNRAVKST